MPMTGMYAGSGAGRGQFGMNNGGNNGGRGSFGRGGGNSNGGRGNYNGGGNYGASGSRNNGGNGNQVSCQLCNKSGHTAKTCRTLSNYQGVSTNANQNQIEEKCQYCNGKGHTASGCFFIIGFPGQQNQVEEPTAMLATTNLAPQFWLADTGATNHMTNDMHFLQNVITYPTNDAVQIGNGKQLAITHSGDTKLGSLNLNNVLYIPELAAHLLSIYQLCKQNNCLVWFDEFMVVIQDKVQGKILYQGLSKHGLYPIPFDLPLHNK